MLKIPAQLADPEKGSLTCMHLGDVFRSSTTWGTNSLILNPISRVVRCFLKHKENTETSPISENALFSTDLLSSPTCRKAVFARSWMAKGSRDSSLPTPLGTWPSSKFTASSDCSRSWRPGLKIGRFPRTSTEKTILAVHSESDKRHLAEFTG